MCDREGVELIITGEREGWKELWKGDGSERERERECKKHACKWEGERDHQGEKQRKISEPWDKKKVYICEWVRESKGLVRYTFVTELFKTLKSIKQCVKNTSRMHSKEYNDFRDKHQWKYLLRHSLFCSRLNHPATLEMRYFITLIRRFCLTYLLGSRGKIGHAGTSHPK